MKFANIIAPKPRGKSPPSRGAWIEIHCVLRCSFLEESPPSRGAWIEITRVHKLTLIAVSRPPRGGRGLKCTFYALGV